MVRQPSEINVTLRTVLGFLAAFVLIVVGMLLAFSNPGGVTITWETASEVDTMGFNLLRAEGSNQEPFQQINAEVIPARGDPLTGTEYQVEDRNVEPGRLYFYQIEEIEWTGTRAQHPEIVQARAGVPRMWLIAEGTLLIVVGCALTYWQVRQLRRPNRAVVETDGA
jgi:hypothetical protein